MARKSKGFAVTLDTLVVLQSPKTIEGDATLDKYGDLDRTEGEWTDEGKAWVSLGPATANGDVTSFTVEMNKRDDVDYDWRLEIKTGPFAGYFLYPQSFGYEQARTRRMFVVCTLTYQQVIPSA